MVLFLVLFITKLKVCSGIGDDVEKLYLIGLWPVTRLRTEKKNEVLKI